MKLEYVIVVPQDLSAGMYGFTDHVTIDFADAKYDGETQRDAAEHFRQALAEWYDGGKVATKAEYDEASILLDKQLEDHP